MSKHITDKYLKYRGKGRPLHIIHVVGKGHMPLCQSSPITSMPETDSTTNWVIHDLQPGEQMACSACETKIYRLKFPFKGDKDAKAISRIRQEYHEKVRAMRHNNPAAHMIDIIGDDDYDDYKKYR